MEIRRDVAGKILERLQKWDEKGEQLPGYIQFYRELLKIQSGLNGGAIVRKPDLTGGLIMERIRQGIPLLAFEDFQPDWQEVQKIFQQLAVWLVKDSGSPVGEAQALSNISHNPLLLKEIARMWYRQHSLDDIKGTEGIEHGLLISIIAMTLKPFLFSYSRDLILEVDQELWHQRYCPICGGRPDLSYLDRERGARWLVCSRCDAEWQYLRLACPCCGTQNQYELYYYTDEDASSAYRLYVCEQCHTYIKTIDLRRAQSDILLPLERLTTLQMDKLAQERGYSPGWSSLLEPVRLTT